MTIDQETVDESILLVTLNRADRLNALDQDHVTALREVLDGVAGYGRTRVVILTGAGRGFCAGLDLKGGGAVPDSDGLGEVQWSMLFQKRFSGLVLGMRKMAPIVIAAVNGVAVGAGFALALGADLRVAGPGARFAVANVKIGLSGCDVGTSYHLPRLVGMQHAADLMLTGRTIDALEAERMGMCTLADDPVAAAIELARAITRNSPFGIAMTKEVMWANADATSFEAALQLEDRTQVLGSLTGDMREAVAAFGEGRPPIFTNR